jgi:hypothetical protein
MVDLPSNSIVIFHSFLYVYQRVQYWNLQYISVQGEANVQKHGSRMVNSMVGEWRIERCRRINMVGETTRPGKHTKSDIENGS